MTGTVFLDILFQLFLSEETCTVPEEQSSDRCIHTRFKTNLHPPTANLTKFQKGVHYSAIKIFNNLPHEIKDLANDILPFRNALKRFLLTNSFYNSKEYFN